MNKAYEMAEIAFKMGEVPVGAIIVHNDEIISQAHNMVETNNNSTLHAEIIAINQAMEILNDKRLENCDIYVTMEPCAMCSGAIAHARFKKVIFGCYDPRSGGIEHGIKIFGQNTIYHTPEIIGGVEEHKCSKIVKDFFGNKR